METKNQQNHFNNPVVIILLVALVGFGGYFLFSKNQNTPEVKQDTDTSQEQIDDLKKELEALKQKESTNSKTVQSIQNKPDLVSIISEWKNRTAFLLCSKTDYNGKLIQQSATAYIHRFQGENGGVRAVTNKHAVLDDYGYAFTNCAISIPGAPKIYTPATGGIVLHENPLFDVAQIYLDNADPYIASIDRKKVCYKQTSAKPYLGDQVVILGYPGIGSSNDITATEGIISGYDYPYFITSAKIDHGNSGGVAILVKDDCYLGLPTGSAVGEIESLGRILDISAFSK